VPYRHVRKRRRGRRPSALDTLLATRFDDVVLAQAEGNPHDAAARTSSCSSSPCGRRRASASRGRSAARPMAPWTPARLGLPTRLADGCAIDEARDAWRAFLKPDDVRRRVGTLHARGARGRSGALSGVDRSARRGRPTARPEARRHRSARARRSARRPTSRGRRVGVGVDSPSWRASDGLRGDERS
jgi:hypothetical protein